jgi:hypothetical protein
MVSLSEDDSNPRVEDAADRHMRLCTQNLNAEKYRNTILTLFNDFKGNATKLNDSQKEMNAAKDSVKLFELVIRNVLRDLSGRTKEFDRNHVGSKTATSIFPGGNISDIISKNDEVQPDVAHSIAQKVLSLGVSHELFPFAEKIEKAVADCRKALAQQVIADQNLGDSKTAMSISKVAVVRQYNANFFAAASDVDKTFAEKLFPQLRSTKKKNGISKVVDTPAKE